MAHLAGYPGYTRWDIGVDYTFSYAGSSELMLFGRSRNASDKDIRLSTSTLRGYAPEAGWSLEVGLRFRY